MHDLEELDAQLAVLRKHGVAEYVGTFTVRFAPVSPMQWALASQPEPEAKTEPPLPPVGAVEPQQFNIEDVLFGAK